MRNSRFTFQGAYHHITSRAYNGINIFGETKYKSYLLFLILKSQKLYKVNVISYCIMDNHYHLIIKDQSAKMSCFMGYINGCFAGFYRRENGGKGYVFQGRYNSKLIQDDSHMINVLFYDLLNPVKAFIVKDPFQYYWSSINIYYSDESLIHAHYVEDYFVERKQFRKVIKKVLKNIDKLEIPVITTPLGEFIGEASNINGFIKKFNRRKKNVMKNDPRMRKRKDEFQDPQKVIKQFEKEYHIKLKKINTHTHNGKKLRGELLIRLKEDAGLTFKEIAKVDIFQNLKFKSLSSLYRNYKTKKKHKNTPRP